MRKVKWPLKKEFAFTIIDDTDGSFVDNIKPVYDYLSSKNIKTTKTVWVFPTRNSTPGQTIQDKNYLEFLLDIESKGFEIQLHNVGSGDFKRDEIIDGFKIFKETFNRFPSLQINHSSNPDNVYWGYKRFGTILSLVLRYLVGKRRFFGDESGSDYFWGDLFKEHIKFTRNRVFNEINTLDRDPQMPFREKNKIYSNYWFSSSDGHSVEEFNNLIAKKNVDRLIREKGLCIVYSHLSYGFLETNGELNSNFKANIDYLSTKNGWFAPATEILDYLLKDKQKHEVSNLYINLLDLKWAIDRVIKKIKYGK